MVTEILAALLLCFILYFTFRRPPGLPPGIWGLPFLGKLPGGETCLADQVEKLRHTYGDIIMWRMGCQINVFLCNPDIIKKAMARPEFSDRPTFFTYTVFGRGEPVGIIFSNGALWHKNRRLTIRHMRDLGMGKTRLETSIQEEAQHLVQDFRQQHTGKAEPLPLSVGVAVFNVAWKMVADKRYDMNDPQARYFVDLVLSTTQKLQGPVFLFNLFPFLLKLAPPFLKKKLGYYALIEGANKMTDSMTEFISQHRDTLDPSQPRDLIDQFLIEQQERGADPNDPHEEINLKVMVGDVFLAAIETSTTTIRWIMLYLAKYPKVQARLQKEIDEVVPKGTLPYYHERNKLPYLEAVIYEVHRLASIVPLSVAHSASQDTQLEGYNIPKGTVLLPHLECCHKDPKFWSHPHLFHPEHFLNPDGTFNSRKEIFMPFGIGRRSCAGESMARVVTFVMVAALVQNFTFTPPPGEDLSTDKDPYVLIINTPKKYKVLITERE